MSEPTTVLGKIGKYTGEKLQELKDQIDSIDLNNITGDVDVTGDIDGINLTATGDLSVGGHLECESLLVKGETKVINTNVVELSDNIIEINLNEDGTIRNNESGISINQGADADKPKLIWNAVNQEWYLSEDDLNLATLNAKIAIPTASDITVDGVALGQTADFENYLNDSL